MLVSKIGIFYGMRTMDSNRQSVARRPDRSRRVLQFEHLETRRLLAFNPTGDEQELMQWVNRFRTQPANEYDRLAAQFSGILKDDLSNPFWTVNLSQLRNELKALNPVPPLIWSEPLWDGAKANNAQMDAQKEQGHYFKHSARVQALIDSGIPLNDIRRTVQNVYGYGKSVLHVHASYVIDWGPGTGGMLNDRPHRQTLIDPNANLAGMSMGRKSGLFQQDVDASRPRMNTQQLAQVDNLGVFITGAIFQDKNGDGWYESGEGLGGVQLTFEAPSANTYHTTGWGSGGYQIRLPAGKYIATASGGGMKYTQRSSEITVGNSNVWKNWIYDPNTIPPDADEANNSLASATELSGDPVSITGLSIHNSTDLDYFKLVAKGTGTGTFTIQFDNASGNLDLQLLNWAGSVIASSSTSANTESVTARLTRGSTYFLKVVGQFGASNGAYSLTVSPPRPVPPVAQADFATFTGATPAILVDVLANDLNPDGSPTGLTPMLAPGSPGAFQVTGQKQVAYTAPAGYSGVQRASYSVTNEQGLTSNAAQISVLVIDFSASLPWQNAVNAADVNDDGQVSPLDALRIINELNQPDPWLILPTDPRGADQIFGFVDSHGDGHLTPLDALTVINRLNGSVDGESEDSRVSTYNVSTDMALMELVVTDLFYDLSRKRVGRESWNHRESAVLV